MLALFSSRFYTAFAFVVRRRFRTRFRPDITRRFRRRAKFATRARQFMFGATVPNSLFRKTFLNIVTANRTVKKMSKKNTLKRRSNGRT